MSEFLNVLVLSSDLQQRKSLLQILDKLSLNVISCSTLGQANDVLSRQNIALVFCDESLSDGSFRELLPMHGLQQLGTRVVVAFHQGEWTEYLEAMRLGAFDVIRWPWRPTDVELVILRAAREHREETRALQKMIA